MRKYFAILVCALSMAGTSSLSARADLKGLANRTAGIFLDYYYSHASQRSWDPELVTQYISTPPSWHNRQLILFRGILNFAPGDSYVQTLEELGFKTEAFPPADEPDLFQPWPVKAGNFLLYLGDHPEAIQPGAVYVGHSSGGFVVYVLAAMASGAPLELIHNELPPLADMPLAQLQEIANRLRDSQAYFISIATPFYGVDLTVLGDLINENLLDPYIPLFITSLNQDYLTELYASLGLWPDQLMDANIIGEAERHLTLGDSFRSWAIRQFIKNSLRFFASFTEPSGPSDGIVPVSSSQLSGPLQVKISQDHMGMVEAPEACAALAEMMLELEI